jgi:hypothetical protein
LSAQKPELHAELEQAWRTWHRTVHTPDLHFERDGGGAGKLTGLDFLRTPGFGGFSFALAFDAGYTGRLAEQKDVWSMTAGDGGEIVAAFGPHRVSGRIGPGACHSAIVSARFSRRISALPGARDYMRLALFLDGELRDTLDADTYIDDSHFAEPTLVGHAQDAADAPKLGEPLLLTVPVEDSDIWRAPDMHAALCEKLRDQPGRQTK